VAEAGNLKLDFMAKKASELIFFFWFEYIFGCYRDAKTTKTLQVVWTLLRSLELLQDSKLKDLHKHIICVMRNFVRNPLKKAINKRAA